MPREGEINMVRRSNPVTDGLLQPGLSRDGICIFVCDSLSTISSGAQDEYLHKELPHAIGCAAMVLGVRRTAGVYAQQPADKAKTADKSTSTDKKNHRHVQEKKTAK